MAISYSTLFDDFSIEITGKDVPRLLTDPPRLPAQSKINVTFLGNEDLHKRRSAARAVKDCGFVPVPHISARRLHSQSELEDFLSALRTDGTVERIFAIAGDPTSPFGPYADALAMITTAPLEDFGVSSIGISGYPEGHPEIGDDKLWAALTHKAAALEASNLSGDIITQFSFDVEPIVTWIEQVRSRGISLPIRIGVPGPAGVKRLLTYAKRFGVSSSAGIAKKYGLSLTNLLGTAGPDKFITELARRLDSERHGEIKLHFYTFGGVNATDEWIRNFTADNRAEEIDVTR